MPVTEKKQIDVFAIIVLILLTLILVFLIISAVYYINISNFIYPSKSESLFLFWTTIILCVIVFSMIIFAFYKIYTHKSIVFDAEKHVVVSPTKKSYTQKPVQVKYSSEPSKYSTKQVVKVQPTIPSIPTTSIADFEDIEL
jgi:hypothetical protein